MWTNRWLKWVVVFVVFSTLTGLCPARGQVVGSRPFPAGFGRFGRFNDDGLLTLNVSPQGFSTPPEVNTLNAQFGNGTARATVTQIDQTQKTLALTGGGPGAPVKIVATLLAPGFSATFGKHLRLTFTGNKKDIFRLFATLDKAEMGGKHHATLLLRRRDKASVPLVLAFRPGFTPSFTVTPVGNASVLTVDSKENIGVVRIVTPFGLKDSAVPLDGPRPNTRLPLVQSDFPVRTSANFSLSPDGKSVTVTEIYKGATYSPLPPVLALALQNGYPVRVEGHVIYPGCDTKYGPFAYVNGPRLVYTLPVPPTDEHGYVRVVAPEAGPHTELLNALVGHLGGDWATNAVDLGYAGMANAQMAQVYLSPDNKKALATAWQKYLPLAFALPPYAKTETKQAWKTETEPFTGQSYLWTYSIDGPRKWRYDLDWGNALPLYGLYKYAAYSGDWDFVRAHWKSVQRIARYFDLGDDWAWMTVVNTDFGYSTGTGDPLCATYAGTIACLKMARAIGDTEAEAKFAFRAARVAVPTVARLWLTRWARERKFITPRSVVLGFWENESFTTGILGKQDPWDATNVLSGDGVLPELFDLYTTYGKAALRAYENDYADGFPEWFQPNVKYPFETTYNGNSVYVTFPHLYARYRLEEPTEQIWQWLDTAQANRNNAWVGPNVVAALLSYNAQFTLSAWQPAAYLDGEYTLATHHITLHFQLPAHPVQWQLKAQLGRSVAIRSVTINGKTVNYTVQGRVLSLTTEAAGTIIVDIVAEGMEG